MSTQKTITWTPTKLDKLKKIYNQTKGDTFEFEGEQLLKAYAKYLIEYLERQLGV